MHLPDVEKEIKKTSSSLKDSERKNNRINSERWSLRGL